MASSNIKPGGGGDYLTLAAWYTAKKASGVQQDAVCFVGNAGDLTVTTWVPPKSVVSVNAADKHNGIDNGTSGIAFAGKLLITAGVDWTFQDLYLTRGIVSTADTITSNRLFNRLLIASANAGDAYGFFNGADNTAGQGPTSLIGELRNSVILVKTGSGISQVISADVIAYNGTSVGVGTYAFNVSVYCQTTPASGVIGTTTTLLSDAEADLALISTNTAIFGPTTCYPGITTFGSGTMDNNYGIAYSASSDATADDWGGTGNLVNQSSASWFTSTPTDLSLKAGSPGIDTGITVGSFSDDIIGATRPQGSAWDIGAFEAAASSGGGLGRKIISWLSVI